MNAFEQRRRMRGQGGFTLIELLVVIAILAVLAGVVVFAVSGINNSSKTSACKIDARSVKTAVQAYNAQTGDYPGTMASIVNGPPKLLEKDSTYVSYTLSSGSPSYAWIGDCATTPGLSSTP